MNRLSGDTDGCAFGWMLCPIADRTSVCAAAVDGDVEQCLADEIDQGIGRIDRQ